MQHAIRFFLTLFLPGIFCIVKLTDPGSINDKENKTYDKHFDGKSI